MMYLGYKELWKILGLIEGQLLFYADLVAAQKN